MSRPMTSSYGMEECDVRLDRCISHSAPPEARPHPWGVDRDVVLAKVVREALRIRQDCSGGGERADEKIAEQLTFDNGLCS